ARTQLRILARLDEQHELEGRMSQLHRALRVGKLGAVDHLGPFEELGERRGIPAVAIAYGPGEKTRAALRLRVPELLVARLGAEGSLVRLGLEGALVVIEPPGQSRIGREAEIDDGVLLAREGALVEERTCPVSHPSQRHPIEGEAGLHLFPVEPQEGGGGGDSVEAMIVVANLLT